MADFRFRKEEKLTKKKAIEDLFETGISFNAFPLKIIFSPQSTGQKSPHQILISVPIRNFKRAVDRNAIKRRIREGYRLNKALFAANPTLCIAYIYIAKEVLPTTIIHRAIQTSADRLSSYEKKN
jgi:ribonuclease P protein component